jgi:hypothetical protein
LQQQKVFCEVCGDRNLLCHQILVRLEENITRDLVAANLLLLIGDENSRLGSLRVLADGHVEPEDVVGVLDLGIGLPVFPTSPFVAKNFQGSANL